MDVWLHDSAEQPDPRRSQRRAAIAERETPTGQSRLAYQLAAVVLVLTALLSAISHLAALTDLGPAFSSYVLARALTILIDAGLAIGLLHFRRGAHTWALIRAVAGILVTPQWLGGLGIAATIGAMGINLGISASILLLLTGTSKTWRLILAAVLYVVFTLIPMWAVVQTTLLERLLAL